MTDDQRGISMRRTQWRSGALTFLPLPDQLRNRAREGRLEVDQLHPRRDHDDPDHAVVERTDLGLPLNPLLGRHLVGAVHLEVLVRDALDDVQLGPTADQQDLWRVHLGVDRQGDRRVVAQGRELGGVLGRAHDDLRAVPDEPDRDRPGCAVLGDVGQAGQVAGQELLADRTVQDLGDLARLHGQTSLPTVVHQYRPSLGLRQWVRWNRAGTSRDDRRALTPCAHLEVSCLPCHRRSWNPSGSRSPRCCPPARSPTRWAATARASLTGSCSTSSSSCWCSAAATGASPTTPARRPPCAVEAGGIPLAAVPAPANQREDGLLAATLDPIGVLGPLPTRPVVHLDAGYDYQPCRQVLAEREMVGQIATRGIPAPIQAGRRWVVERTHAWGNQYGKLRWCTERRRLVVEFWLALANA